MAGESPDKSVDEGAPGAAESSAGRDPRLSVFRPRDPEGGGVARSGAGVEVDVETGTGTGAEPRVDAEADADAQVGSGSGSGSESDADAEVGTEGGAGVEARAEAEAETDAEGEAGERDALRDAVAAWVASAEDADADTDADTSADTDADTSAGADADTSAGADADTSAGADEDPAPGESVDSASADAKVPAGKPEGVGPDPSEARTEEHDSDSASASDPVEEPVDNERTAVFRAVKPPVTPAPAAEAKPADSERTAVFRAVKSDSDSTSVPESPKPEPAADEPADSERTAVFRAVKPPSVSAPVDEAEPAEKPATDRPADNERTAVFRVPKVDAVKAETPKPAAKPAAPRPSLAKPAEARFTPAAPAGAKPAEAKPAGAKPAEAEPAAEAPKGSTFVPLRPEGTAPATPAAGQRPKPPVTPASRFDRIDGAERTTQQPLPPKPPLDMLADLTNNPPPPPSPMRTAIRRFKIYAPLVALLALILAVVQLVRPLPEPKLVMTAKSSYTFDGAAPQLPWPAEGQAYMAAAGLGTLGQSGEQKPVPIASVTKSMTAYIILRDHPIKKGEQGAMIDVDKTAETEGKKNNSTDNESTLDTVKEGDKISEYDAIAALMIPSANNIARLLARWDSGSQEAFVKKMNETAKELGMTRTTYTDPSGLDATTVSTAEDQVKLGLKLVEIETLLDITKKPSWIDPSGKKWDNWNRLVPYNDSLGIKTGTTTKAGGNLLFAAQKKVGNTNQLIVGAVLGQHKAPIIDTVIAASKQLMIATQKALEGAPVVTKGAVVGYVDDGLGGRTPVVATADVQAVGWASLTVDVKLADGGGKLPQTAKAGTEVGLLTVGEGASQVKVPVALKDDLAAPGIGSKLTRVG
ncbi:D-alanyl-D-alanine carboxypeptidase [Streptomyces avidinii]|uniref:D-alanyl-D-alanine carboxypeptidase n=1 Tax=Streptomyces avidinii TaxID=1895 RepID=UPI0037B7696C